MKFALISLLIVFALSTCEKQPDFNREKAIQCIHEAVPIFEEIVDIIALVKNKKWTEISPKVIELITHIKELYKNCIEPKSKEIMLQVAIWPIVKAVWTVGVCIYNGVRFVMSITR